MSILGTLPNYKGAMQHNMCLIGTRNPHSLSLPENKIFIKIKWLENNFGSLKAKEGEDYHENHLGCRHKSSIRSLRDSSDRWVAWKSQTSGDLLL